MLYASECLELVSRPRALPTDVGFHTGFRAFAFLRDDPLLVLFSPHLCQSTHIVLFISRNIRLLG